MEEQQRIKKEIVVNTSQKNIKEKNYDLAPKRNRSYIYDILYSPMKNKYVKLCD